MKNLIMNLFIILFVIIMIPCILTFYYTKKTEKNKYSDLKEAQIIDNINGKEYNMDIESYVEWSAAATTPICFHLEALKAQVIISRTNTYHKLESLKKTYPDFIFPVSELELPYITKVDLEDRIGKKDMEKYIPVLEEAVQTTKGQIVDSNKTILFFPNADKMAELGQSHTVIISQYFPNLKYKMVENN